MNEQLTCGFIGLGLIGGSIARALRKFHPECRLLAYDINKQALMDAVSDGVSIRPLKRSAGNLQHVTISFYALPFPKMTLTFQKYSLFCPQRLF